MILYFWNVFEKYPRKQITSSSWKTSINSLSKSDSIRLAIKSNQNEIEITDIKLMELQINRYQF